VSHVGCRPAGTHVYCWPVDTRKAAQRWADVWERGWREHDAAAIAALYAEDAFWQQHPFREPELGYLARVFAEEESAQCRFGPPIVDGDQAAVPWSAQTRLTDGGTENLAGGVIAALQGRRARGGRARLLGSGLMRP
jgi:SnoaL-like domain